MPDDRDVEAAVCGRTCRCAATGRTTYLLGNAPLRLGGDDREDALATGSGGGGGGARRAGFI